MYKATLQRKFQLCIPSLGIAWPKSKFPLSCVCEQFIYSQDLSTYFLQQNRQIDRSNILIAHRHMNVKIETVAAQFFFWEYLFPSFSISPLQCIDGILVCFGKDIIFPRYLIILICFKPTSYLHALHKNSYREGREDGVG